MNNQSLGRLVKVDLREVWASEASGFTPWLARQENLKLLGEALGLDLELEAQERNVGAFRADLLCKEADAGRTVVIENQIESTDHGHLGQLLTYAAGLDAAMVVWIAQAFEEEHRAALDWLNEKANGGASFFGIEIEVWKIRDSTPAPKFNVVAKPNEWSNRVKQAARQAGLSGTEQMRVDYWMAMIAFLKSTGSSLRCREALPNKYLNVASPIPGYRCGFEFYVSDRSINTYFGSVNPDGIKMLRRLQKKHSAEIERAVGREIVWHDNKTTGRFYICPCCEADPSDTNDWPRQHQWMKVTLEKLIAAVSKHLEEPTP